LILAAEAEGADIVTAEGLADEMELAPIQKSFVEHGALQCGFCTPSFVLVAHHLLKSKPKPTADEIKEYLSGHICRCGAYKQMIEAIMKLAEERKEEIPVAVRLPPQRKKKKSD
jgi:carbon-monoxide dehydrogenase small subunit